MQKLRHQRLSFGDFTLHLGRGCLVHGGREVKLRPKSFEVLKYLVEHSRRLVGKDELIAAVWPDTAVTDDSLVQCLIEIRRALEDDSHRYIKTVPRRGYIFEAEVVERDIVEREVVYTEEVEGVRVAIEEEVNEAVGVDVEPISGAGEVALPPVKPLALTGRKRSSRAVALVLVCAVIALAASALLLSRLRSSSSEGQPVAIRSVAVLPLDNISGDATQDYFADGMTDALISELARIGALRVISRTSVMMYKGERKKPVPEIGRELNVDAVVEGAVTRAGERVRITVNLIRAATDEHLWAKSYERDLRDILAMQSEIGSDVASELKAKLTPQEKRRSVSARPVNPEAHEAYLKGRYYFNQGINEQREEILEKSAEYFEQAIRIDPNYALAYEALSGSYHWIASYGIREQELYPKAKAAALKAIELDDTLAHESLAFILYHHDWDWAGAEREFRRAIELNPNGGHHGYALFLSALGHHKEAIAEIKLAEERDPLILPIKLNAGRIYLRARQFDRALEQFRNTLELKPDDAQSHIGLGETYAHKGMKAEALAEMRKAFELLGSTLESKANLAWAYAVAGQRDEAIKIVSELERLSDQPPALLLGLASIYTALGEKDEAFAWLQRVFEKRSQALVYVNTNPRFDGLRSDPRFADLVRRIGLAP